MKPCIHLDQQKANKRAAWVMLIFTQLGFSLFLFVAIHSMLAAAWFFCLLFGFLLCYYAIPFCAINTTKYRVAENGIEVGGPLRRTKLYTWDQIHRIGVYAYGANAGLNGYFSAICVFLKPVPDGFSSLALKASLISAKWMRTMIRIDYSAVALHELSEAYSGVIHDFRQGQIRGNRSTMLP